MTPLIIASFLFLTPAEKPENGHIETTMPPVPEMNIRRRFGEKTFLEVPCKPEYDIAFYRLLCGFGAWAKGADGIVHETPPEFADAVEGAKCDAALLDRLAALRGEAMASADPEVRLVGRKIGHFLANLDTDADPDLSHLEGMKILRDSERALGKPLTLLAEHVKQSVRGGLPSQLDAAKAAEAAAAEAKAAGAGGRRKYREPPMPEMAQWPEVNLRAGTGRTEFAPGFLCNYSFQWRSFQIGVKGDRKIAKDEAPGGVADITLWIPDKEPDKYLVYRIKIDLGERPQAGPPLESEGWAPDPCWAYYVHERRFPNLYPPASEYNFVSYEKSRLWNRDYPYPQMAGATIETGEDPWWMLYSLALCSLPEHLPMLTRGVQDVWFGRISYRGRTAQARFVWPAGSDSTELAVYKGYPLESFWQTFPPIYEEERRRWGWGEDDRFYRSFAGPLLDGDGRLFDMLKSCNGQPPAIGREVAKVQLKCYGELPRNVFIKDRVEQVRKQYLVDILEGREPVPPDVRKPEKKAVPALPELDAGPLMELDEEVF